MDRSDDGRDLGMRELLTRGDVCHVHANRVAAERCGVLLGGALQLVRRDEVRPAVYHVAWSLEVDGRWQWLRRLDALARRPADRPRWRPPTGGATWGSDQLMRHQFLFLGETTSERFAAAHG